MGYINPFTGTPAWGGHVKKEENVSNGEAQANLVRESASAEGPMLNAASKKRLDASSVLRENREKWADLFLARLLFDKAERRDPSRDSKLRKLNGVPLAAFIGNSLSGDFVKNLQNYLDEKDSPFYGYEKMFSFAPVLTDDISEYAKNAYASPDKAQLAKGFYSSLGEWRDRLLGADRLSKAVVVKMLLDFYSLGDTEDSLGPYLNRKDSLDRKLANASLGRMGLGKYAQEPSSPWALGVVKKYDKPISGFFDPYYGALIDAGKPLQEERNRKFRENVQSHEDFLDFKRNKNYTESVERGSKAYEKRVAEEKAEDDKKRTEAAEDDRREALGLYQKYLDILFPKDKSGKPFQYDDFEVLKDIARSLKELGDSRAAEEVARNANRRLREEFPEMFGNSPSEVEYGKRGLAQEQDQERKLDNQLAGYIEKIQEYASVGEDETAKHYADRYNEVAAKHGRPLISDRRMKRRKPRKGMTRIGRLGSFLSSGLFRIGGE